MSDKSMHANFFFHSCLSFVYLLAFISLYVQVDGLYGRNGLLPIDDYVIRVRHHFGIPNEALSWTLIWSTFKEFPSIIIFASEIGVTVDGLAEFCILLGISFSCFGIIGFHNGFIFLVLWICYLGIYLLGQTFMSFQWDILLLEVGFITIISSCFRKPIFSITW